MDSCGNGKGPLTRAFTVDAGGFSTSGLFCIKGWRPVDKRAQYNRMVVSMLTVLDHDRIFGALGDATRRDIVRQAIDGDEGVAELAEHYPMSFAAVQKHVAILERAGLVTKHRMGRRKVVRTNLEGLRVARRLLDRYEELWRERVERIGQLLKEEDR
jgi:DNA-binding transcriptional ArsR family regulator